MYKKVHLVITFLKKNSKIGKNCIFCCSKSIDTPGFGFSLIPSPKKSSTEPNVIQIFIGSLIINFSMIEQFDNKILITKFVPNITFSNIQKLKVKYAIMP